MRFYTSNITQRSNVMLSEVEASKSRSLLKVNEILCNKRNTAIRLLVYFSTCGPYNPHTYTPYKPQVRHWHATEQCSDAIYR